MTRKVTHKRTSLNDLPEIITPEQLASTIGSHPNVVRRQCVDGTIPAVKVGSRWYISRDVVLGGLIKKEAPGAA